MFSATVVNTDLFQQACQIIHDCGGQVYLDGKPASEYFTVTFSLREQVPISTLKSG